MTAEDDVAFLVAFIAEHGDADDLLREHSDDGSGRCSVCSAGGGTGRVTHPCNIRRAALAAQGDGS